MRFLSRSASVSMASDPVFAREVYSIICAKAPESEAFPRLNNDFGANPSP